MADCAVSPEMDLVEMGEALSKQLGKRRIPLSGTLELTERCNLGCLHCYIKQPGDSQVIKASELSLHQIQCLIDEITDAGCFFLLITGGEPLLRPDFHDIWRYAKKKGILLTLFTNGTLIDEKMAEFLAVWRPIKLEITLYGARQKTYEKVTGVPGSYARCHRGIDLLLKRGIRITLKSVLIKENIAEIEAMKSYAESLGVDYRFDGVLWPRLDGGRKLVAHRLTPEEVVTLDEIYPERQKEFKRLYQDFRGKTVRNEYIFNCGAGRFSFHVDSTGRLSPCMMARQPTYDLMRGGFREGWAVIGKALQKCRTKDTPCQSCEVGVLCTQCPGWSQLVHNDDETPAEYICEIGRLRANQILGNIQDKSAE